MNNLLIRIGIAITFLTHSLHGIINNDVTNFGKLFLNQIGFAPFGVAIAWAVILSQLVGSLLLVFNKFTKLISIVFILILINGIIFVHFKAGWFVVGGGRNGMEFSCLLIICLVQIMLQNKMPKNKTS
jgi:putative oxidoreductase